MKVRRVVSGTAIAAVSALGVVPAAVAGGGGGVTSRVSVSSMARQADDGSSFPSISADGRFVAFTSGASNLAPGDRDESYEMDVFVRDRLAGTTRRVSISTTGEGGDSDSSAASISGDGRRVAFQSRATNLVPGDSNGIDDVFVRDRVDGVTSRVSVATDGGQTDGYSGYPAISADGRFVAFYSYATNLVPADTNGIADVFVRDLVAGTTIRATVSSSGAQADNYGTSDLAVSADGRFVAFVSSASNLVHGDTNQSFDVFVRNVVAGVTRRVSVSSRGAQADSQSWGGLAVSADGRLVAFNSRASNLVRGDTNGTNDIFVHNRVSGFTSRVSVASSGAQTSSDWDGPIGISADGRYVTFASTASNLVPADTNAAFDVFVRDRRERATRRVSVATSGAQADGISVNPAISGDGRHVAFSSWATNLVRRDTNAVGDVFVRDPMLGGTLDASRT